MVRGFVVLGLLVSLPLGWSCRADEEKNEASFRVVPSQVMLGALPFGRDGDTSIPIHIVVTGLPPGVQVSNIDCSHAQGIRVVGRRYDNKNMIVEMEADVQKLCAGEPYGAFIKRDIRLETNCQVQPQFVVPITGWLDINTTPRDFNQFVFLGVARWHGIWSSPNIAGALLTGFALLVTGVIGWLGKLAGETRGTLVIVGLVMAIGVICPILLWLGQTYSREAWVALFVAGVVGAICCPPLRRAALGVLLSFAIILLLLPHGVQRCESYTNLTGDLSIANRLKLWEGALQMMAEHPFIGVGSGQFETVFERDYQGFNHTAKTATAVNDCLTFGAEHGLFFLSLIIGPVLLLVTSALRLVCKTHSILLMTLTAVLIGTLITSSFSTLWMVPDYQWLVGITLLGVAGYVVMTGIRVPERLGFANKMLLRLSGWTIVTLVVLFSAAVTSLSLLPTRIFTYHIYERGVATASCRVVSPRWQTSHGTIIYLTSVTDQSVLYHSTIRPIAAMGWQVIPLADTTDPAKVRYLIDALHQLSPEASLFVAGDARGGKSAWKIAAGESPKIVKAGGGFDFLTMDLASDDSTSAPRQRFLVYQSLYSEGASSNPAICAQKQVAFKGLPLTVILSRDGVDHFSAGWMRFLATLNAFFLNENHHS
jgi:hypothetical protein